MAFLTYRGPSAIPTVPNTLTTLISRPLTVDEVNLNLFSLDADIQTRALINQTVFLGTTAIQINRTSALLVLNGVTVDNATNAVNATTSVNVAGQGSVVAATGTFSDVVQARVFQNANQLAANLTVPANNNMMVVGPFQINNGVTLTVQGDMVII